MRISRLPLPCPSGNTSRVTLYLSGWPQGRTCTPAASPRHQTQPATMRFLVLSSLLCILLLCFSISSVEGKRHRRHPAKPFKGKLCCSQHPSPVLKTQNGRRRKTCRPCKTKSESHFWVVPGALPQV
ncbi:colon-derived SUSD2 binding factor [Rhinolophus ferrumequinum]|uniref:Colon-derived SUSD2 binding factor n=1 Tax=Rhinolophus ferrumequinum TaxID=59479 RepID=A0A7J7UW06_RHIFE|nr:colon-derived SUSD2 binding factor [Rhinolophus ferrumequinum]